MEVCSIAGVAALLVCRLSRVCILCWPAGCIVRLFRLQTIKSRPSDQGKKVTASIYFALAAALAFLAVAYLVAPARFLASAFGTPGESMVGWQQCTLALGVVAKFCSNASAEKGEECGQQR